MKSNYLLLIVGIAGIIFAGYATFMQKDSTTSLIAFVSGASLVWAYFELSKPKKINK